MKLHEIKENSQIFIKKDGELVYRPYTTKETKSYFAEAFQPLDLGADFDFSSIKLHTGTEIVTKDLLSDLYLVIEEDNYTAIVFQDDMNFYCNIPEEA